MKGFSGLVLCDEKREDVDIHVKATLSDGGLLIEGDDVGPLVEMIWGDLDYEYWYRFDRENTKRLLEAIDGTEDPEAAMLAHFSGEGGCAAMRELCEKENITWEFFSYA